MTDRLEMYQRMAVIRRTENAAFDLFMSGPVKGTTHLASGHEVRGRRHDPVAAVVLGAEVSTVEGALVDGEWRKRDFRLRADVANARTLVETRATTCSPRPRPGRRLDAHVTTAGPEPG